MNISSEAIMRQFGERLGQQVTGGQVLELVGDVGAGKTTLVRGIALGMGVDETVQSPSFTINRVYDGTNGRRLVHYDFYRLQDPGIMANELAEAVADKDNVIIIEWGDVIEQILPTDRLTIRITSPSETTREIEIISGGEVSNELLEEIT